MEIITSMVIMDGKAQLKSTNLSIPTWLPHDFRIESIVGIPQAIIEKVDTTSPVSC